MPKSPSYEELHQKVNALEKQVIEIKKSEAVLRGNEQDYRDLYENAPIAYFSIKRNDGTIARFNYEAVRLLGYRQETLAQMNVLDLYADTAHGIARAKALFERFQAGESVRDEELQMKRADGQVIWVNLNIEPVRRDGGDVVESRSMVIDISERKQAESALRESEERFRSVTEQSPSMIFINKKGKLVYCNKRCKAVMGYTQEEFYSPNFDFFDLISEESKKTVKSALAKLLKGQEIEPFEHGLVTRGGDEIDAIITTKLIQYEGDTAILGILTDITLRKKMEDALSQSEAKFRALAESAPAAIIIVAGKDFIYVNPAFESITGFSREEALGMRFWDLIHPDMREPIRERGLARQRGKAVPAHYELKALTKDGRKIWFDLATASINYGGQIATLAMAYDITDRKRAEEALREKDNKLEFQAKNLIEMNTALKVLLEQREKEKTEMKDTLLANVKKLVLPYIEKLENMSLNADAQTFVNIIKSNINDLISPLASNLSPKYFTLTPTEIQIADLIKQGKTSKEIASMLNVSPKAVSFHRGNLRKKLGLLNKKINLRTFLQSFPH